MRYILFTAGLLFVQQEPAQDGALKDLQGTWRIVSVEKSGKPATVAGLGIDQIIIKGERMTLKNRDKEVASYGLRLFANQKPNGMDWIHPNAKASLPTIYSLEGDELRLCFPLLEKGGQTVRPERPKSFDTEGTPHGVIAAKRVT